jgi:hypothetical protein
MGNGSGTDLWRDGLVGVDLCADVKFELTVRRLAFLREREVRNALIGF